MLIFPLTKKKGYTLPDVDDSVDEEGGFLVKGNAEMVQINLHQREARERNKEIRKIAETIMDLKSLFLDISDMVVTQGTILDRIDQNLNVTEQHVDVGVAELTQAKAYESSTAKCWLVLLLIIIIFSIVVVIVIRSRRT